MPDDAANQGSRNPTDAGGGEATLGVDFGDKAAADKAAADKAAADKAAADKPADKAAADKPADKAAADKAAADKAAADKAAADKAAADKAAKDKGEPVPIPESMEEFGKQIKLPEGVKLDPEQLKPFHELMRNLKPGQDGAQQLVDFELSRQKNAVAVQEQEWNKTTTRWLEGAKKDAEIGGEQFSASVDRAKAFIKEFGTPELISLFKDLGVDKHPEVIRIFARGGKHLENAPVVKGRSTGDSPRSPAARMFPSMKGSAE